LRLQARVAEDGRVQASQRLAVLILLAGFVTAPVASFTAAGQVPPSQQDVDAFVRDVLLDAVTVRRFPDISSGRERYNVQSDLPRLKMVATRAALPDIPGSAFTLVTRAEAQVLAERSNQDVPFITIDIIAMTATEASAQVGTDIAMPARPGVVKLCCCTGVARYTRQNGRWAFVQYGPSQCA